MTEPGASEETPEGQNDQDKDADVDKPEQPSIDEDELADMGAVAEAVEQDVAQDDQDDDDQDDDVDELELDEDRTSIGDVYCNVLGMAGAVAKDELGSGLEDDRKQILDEYADLARDLDIDDAVDDLLEEHGGSDSLTPGQTVVIMSVVWFGMVAFDDPEIIEGLANGGPQ